MSLHGALVPTSINTEGHFTSFRESRPLCSESKTWKFCFSRSNPLEDMNGAGWYWNQSEHAYSSVHRIERKEHYCCLVKKFNSSQGPLWSSTTKFLIFHSCDNSWVDSMRGNEAAQSLDEEQEVDLEFRLTLCQVWAVKWWNWQTVHKSETLEWGTHTSHGQVCMAIFVRTCIPSFPALILPRTLILKQSLHPQTGLQRVRTWPKCLHSESQTGSHKDSWTHTVYIHFENVTLEDVKLTGGETHTHTHTEPQTFMKYDTHTHTP